MRYTRKSFDFYKLSYVRNNGISYDYDRINSFLEKTHQDLESGNDVHFMECKKDTYIGFSEIEKYYHDETDDFVWVFNLCKCVTSKVAIVNNLDQKVNEGRATYGETEKEGLTTDTVVLFCPKFGVVVIPSNRGGLSKSDFISFFYKNVKKQGANLDLIINNTDLKNIESIDQVKEFEVSVHRITDGSLSKSSNTINKDQKIIGKLDAREVKIQYKADHLNIKELIKYARRLLKIENGETKKLKITGTHDGQEQVIDLISNRLFYVDNEVDLNENGKLTVNSMLHSIKKAYLANLKIIQLDS